MQPKHFLQALDLLKTHDFRRYHAIVLTRIAQVYDAQGDFQASNRAPFERVENP